MNHANHTVEIYILLTHTGTNFSNIIRSYTKSEYTHVSLGLNKELTELYSFGRKNPTNPIFGGFVKENLNGGVFEYFKETTCSVYSLKIPYSSYMKINQMLSQFLAEKDKYKYSLFGLFGIMFNTPIERDNAFFCSQFVSHILKEAGLCLFDKPCGLIQPTDFEKIEGTQLIYKGKLSNYPYYIEQEGIFSKRDDKVLETY